VVCHASEASLLPCLAALLSLAGELENIGRLVDAGVVEAALFASHGDEKEQRDGFMGRTTPPSTQPARTEAWYCCALQIGMCARRRLPVIFLQLRRRHSTGARRVPLFTLAQVPLRLSPATAMLLASAVALKSGVVQINETTVFG
jgi:hypothetical protein